MTAKTSAIVTSALIAGFAIMSTPARAQGPLYDRVDVNLPYTVTLGDTTLQPGDYIIRELPSQTKERVLLIYSQDGNKHEATVMTIPALKNQTPDDTRVLLHHYGPDYYFDKIWIAGKNYGYEFPVPANVKERQREREGPVSVAANYQPPPPAETKTAAAAPPPAQPAPQPESQPAPAVQPPAPPPPPASHDQVAQNTPPPPTDNSANREAPETPKQLPSTSADWVMMLLGGGGLSGLGLALRRRR
jgi:LPXTG-motif cell wall-anchored protein